MALFFGQTIVYIMPAMLLLSLPEEGSVAKGLVRKGRTKGEIWLARGTVAVGTVLVVLGRTFFETHTQVRGI